MPGEFSLRCAECSVVTSYREIKYTGTLLKADHKPDCSQRHEAFPRFYTVFHPREENPSV